LPGSALSKQIGRITFLLSCVLVAGLSGAALRLLQAHAESRRAWMAVGYCLILLGVFWIRSLERRLADAGLPRWSFWPYFLIVFTGCLAAHGLKVATSPETLGLFLLLQLPAVLFESKSAPAELSPEGVKLPVKPARPVAPLGAFEFAVFVLLIAGLWQVRICCEATSSAWHTRGPGGMPWMPAHGCFACRGSSPCAEDSRLLAGCAGLKFFAPLYLFSAC